jgi:hypothetical protein
LDILFDGNQAGGLPPGRPGCQALAGAEAQEERLDGRKFQDVPQVDAGGGRQIPLNDMEMGFVLILFHRVNLRLDVVGVKPKHKVGHRNHLSFRTIVFNEMHFVFLA